jgi:hypothetical protein
VKSKIWKHHTAEHFENGTLTQDNATAAAGSTVFTDYDAMIKYLKRTRQRWYIAELEVDESEIRLYKNGPMATILVDKPTTTDFKYIETNE